MMMLSRAILYLRRKKSRSFLLLILILIMCNMVLTGSVLKKSADSQMQIIRQNLGSSFLVSADTKNESLYEERTDKEYSYKAFVGETVTPETIEKVKSINGVVDYVIDEENLVWTNLKLRPGLYADSSESAYTTLEQIENFRQTTLAISCREGELNANFRIGAFSISEGKNIEEDDREVAIISEYVAKNNHLSVGDTIKLETRRGIFEPCDDPTELLGIPVEVKIIGIFSINFEQESSVYTPESEYADNFIFIDANCGLQLKRNISGEQAKEQYGKVTFLVDNPENLINIMEEVDEVLSDSNLVLEQDDLSYGNTIRPLKNISLFATVQLICGVLGCAFILYLVLTLWVKGRSREIGVLLSIGEKRQNIIVQFILECLIVSSISIGITLVSSSVVTQNICNIAEKISEPRTSEESYSIEFGYGETMPTISKVSSTDVKLEYTNSALDMLMLIITIYVICSISVFLASLRILKMSPKLLLQTL